MPARTGILPTGLARENAGGVPTAALLTTNVSVQLFLLLVLVVEDALDFMLSLDTALTLVPYLLAAAYAVKIAVTRETYGPGDERERRRHLLIGALAVGYSLYLLYAAGAEYLLLGCLVYAPGTLLYLAARREHGDAAFTRWERLVCAGLTVAAGLCVLLLSTGVMTT
jgi:arginine:ornithine antiporter/lysine permease